jgi:hypothetical protein
VLSLGQTGEACKIECGRGRFTSTVYWIDISKVYSRTLCLRMNIENTNINSISISPVLELCRRTQQPSLTFHLIDGSTFGLRPLFHLRDGGKWTEMTATKHGTLISSLHHNTNYACFFHWLFFFKFILLLFLSLLLSIAIYRLQVTTFLTAAWVAIPSQAKRLRGHPQP